jgi:hypothetical protein
MEFEGRLRMDPYYLVAEIEADLNRRLLHHVQMNEDELSLSASPKRGELFDLPKFTNIAKRLS